MQVKNSPEFLIHKQNLETIYNVGSSINGPITNAIDISSCPGKELIAIARANGEFRARVVMVRLAYSEYVKLIFSDIIRLMVILTTKKTINGTNIITIESTFSNNNFPWLAKMQNTASDKNQISNLENKSFAFLFKFSFNMIFVIAAAMNGMTITINKE